MTPIKTHSAPRILFVSASDPWSQASGYFQYSTRFVEILAREHEVVAVSLFKPGRDLLPPPGNVRRIAFRSQRLSARKQRVRSLLSRRSFCEWEFNYDGTWEWLTELIEVERPALLIFNHIRAAWLAPRLTTQNIPVIYIAHNAESFAYLSIARLEPNPFGKLFALIESVKLLALERRIFRGVTAVVALTPEDEARFTRIRTDLPVHVVPPSMPARPFVEQMPEREVILIVGSFHWRPKLRNVLWFLHRVFPGIRQKRPSARCVIVGANAAAITRMAEFDGVEIHSDVDSVAPFFATGGVFVTPERQWGGIKLKTCEAASHGLPIVSTPAGVEGTGLEDGSSCLMADKPDEFERSILRCLEDRSFARQLGQRAHAIAEARFAPAAVTETIRQTIRTTVRPIAPGDES